MQHYQTVKEGEGAAVNGEGEARGDDGDMGDDDEGLTAPQTLADLDVLQDQDIGHTTTVPQPDLQVCNFSTEITTYYFTYIIVTLFAHT